MSILKHISYDLTGTGSQQETVDDSAIIFHLSLDKCVLKELLNQILIFQTLPYHIPGHDGHLVNGVQVSHVLSSCNFGNIASKMLWAHADHWCFTDSIPSS